jgi:hypothetical protein
VPAVLFVSEKSAIDFAELPEVAEASENYAAPIIKFCQPQEHGEK